MTARRDRLAAVARFYANTEREHARAFEAARLRATRENARLDEMKAMLQEYRGGVAKGASLSAARLRDVDAFLRKLVNAVDAQTAIRNQAAGDAQRARQVLLAAVNKRMSLDRLRRARADAQRVDERRAERREQAGIAGRTFERTAKH